MYFRAFRWTQGAGMRDLGALPGDNRSIANAVSSDGNTVVGYAYYSGTSHYAVRWTPSGTSWNIQSLGTLGGDRSEATAASADGSVIVGWSDTVGNFESRAFRWTVSGGMQDIGVGVAHDVSADGNVIVGEGYNNNYYAFRWTSGGGMENLNTTYANLLTNGSRLEVAYAISSDGRYIVGKGYNAATRRFEAFLLDTGSRCTTHSGDVDSSGCVDDADLLSVLFAFGSSGSNLGRVDVNCDGTVDDADLLQVLFNFGSGC
jgi:probable HAF family extracellular repeat protein